MSETSSRSPTKMGSFSSARPPKSPTGLLSRPTYCSVSFRISATDRTKAARGCIELCASSSERSEVFFIRPTPKASPPPMAPGFTLPRLLCDMRSCCNDWFSASAYLRTDETRVVRDGE